MYSRMSRSVEFNGVIDYHMGDVIDYNMNGVSISGKPDLKLSYQTRQFGIFQIRCCANIVSGEVESIELDQFRSEPSLNMFKRSDREYIKQTAFIAMRVFLYGGECLEL